MRKIVHVTDTHLRADDALVLGLNPAARLRDVVRSINENHADAACCVLTGDIADAGEVAAYEIARDCLAGLKVPLYVTVGNHDSRAAFRKVFPNAPATVGGFVQTCVDIGSHSLVIVDTLDEEHPGQGLVCGERLAWLDAEMTRLAEKPAIVFMHHPPLSIGLAWFDAMLIANGPEVIALLARHKNVAHLGFGHVHVNTAGNWRGIGFSGSRGTCHKILADPPGLSADYVDQGPAYDLLLVTDDAVCVHSIDPAGPNRLIAREFPTPDERGAFEDLRGRVVERWM